MSKKIEKQELSKKVLPILKEMRVFQMESWPINRMHTIFATVYKVKVMEDKDFKVHANRKESTIEVTRIK